MQDPDKSLNVGWIPYWNLLPLKRELAAQRFEPALKSGSPTLINKWLAEGSIHCAPCSSICLITQSPNEIFVPYGVAASGPVESVYLGLSSPNDALVRKIQHRNQELAKIFRKHSGSDQHTTSFRRVARSRLSCVGVKGHRCVAVWYPLLFRAYYCSGTTVLGIPSASV